MVEEEICGNVVEVRRKSDRIMAIVLTLGREVMRVICAYGPQSGRLDAEKVCFYDKIGSEWFLGISSEIIVSLGILMDMWGNVLRVLKLHTEEMVLGKEVQKEEDYSSFVMKESCPWQIFGLKKTDKRKITYSAGGCETEIDFVLVGENTESI